MNNIWVSLAKSLEQYRGKDIRVIYDIGFGLQEIVGKLKEVSEFGLILEGTESIKTLSPLFFKNVIEIVHSGRTIYSRANGVMT